MITMKDFVPEKDPILREHAQEVSFPLSKEDYELATKMREFLINSQDEAMAEKYQLRPGVGVAAPQIGQSKQIFAIYIMDYDEEGNPTEPKVDQIVINPKLISHSIEEVALKDGEGCLSVRRAVPGYVPRPKRAKIKFYDLEGKEHVVKLRNYEAIVFQHELDHLKGIMFYDHINSDAPWAHADNVTII